MWGEVDDPFQWLAAKNDAMCKIANIFVDYRSIELAHHSVPLYSPDSSPITQMAVHLRPRRRRVLCPYKSQKRGIFFGQSYT